MRAVRSLCLLAALPALLAWQVAGPPGRVCPDSARPCAGFRPHDLSFVLPADGAARAEDRSAPFYAVILRSGAREPAEDAGGAGPPVTRPAGGSTPFAPATWCTSPRAR